MLSSARLREIAGERVGQFDERCEDYHSLLIDRFLQLLSKHLEGLSEKRRRQEVDQIISAFAQQIVTEDVEVS